MGFGEYGGNGSIHWSVDHQDGQNMVIRRNDRARPAESERSCVHANKCTLKGRDPRGEVEYFDVTLRFEPTQTPNPIEQLTKALEEARAHAAESTFFVTFRVPATVDQKQRKKPGQKPWPDVRVQW